MVFVLIFDTTYLARNHLDSADPWIINISFMNAIPQITEIASYP